MGYWKNLLTALAGSNPYQEELDRVKKEYKKTAERVGQLDEMYYKLQDEISGADKKVTDYQNLIENLRQRLVDKDAFIAQMKEGYEKRIAEYKATISELQKKK